MAEVLFDSLRRKPSLVVFDLDLTLWPFDCIDFSYAKLTVRDSKVCDNYNNVIEPFPDSGEVLKRISEEPGVKLAAASATDSPSLGREFIRLFGWDKYFDYLEIYPTAKTKHFRNLARKSGIPYKNMLFFDDLTFNIQDVEPMGVHCVHVPNGVNLALVRRALENFARSRL
ncbi:hypothetical protein Aperf_G00000051868 [Anoplocephala perfoliata]